MIAITPEMLLEWMSKDGVAIAVAVFVLFRLEGKLDKIIEKLEALA